MVVFGVAAVSAGCGSETPTTPSQTAPFTPGVTEALATAIDDEYRAETMYEGVVADFGLLLPFANVLQAEQRHSTSIARLFSAQGLSVPANSFTLATVPHFPTLTAACASAAAAERSNIAMYDTFLALALPADVRQVFLNNRAASLDNHLPAFERCS
jgi:hypothetical protein